MRQSQLGFLGILWLGREHHLVARNRLKSAYMKLLGYPGILPKITLAHTINELLAVPLPAEPAILDAGCGMGFLSFYLARQFPKGRILAIDSSEDKISRCDRIARTLDLANIEFRVQRLEDIQEVSEFDLICCADVMEHVPDDETVLSNFRRALNPDGRLIVSVPLPMGDQWQFIKTYSGIPQHAIEDATEHVRDGYTPEGIDTKLTAAGFEICNRRFTFGKAGRIAFELSVFGWNRQKLWNVVSLLTYPIAIIPAYIDTAVKRTAGNAIVLTAALSEP
jgi:2-polyprenyl-3-methyl-5-hydroxy-6-metoxy-1,4-benzoquinol methylase